MESQVFRDEDEEGVRVCRGPDWKWGDQDSDGLGTTVAAGKSGWIGVRWDNGISNIYRVGIDGCFDLCVAASATSGSDAMPSSSNQDVRSSGKRARVHGKAKMQEGKSVAPATAPADPAAQPAALAGIRQQLADHRMHLASAAGGVVESAVDDTTADAASDAPAQEAQVPRAPHASEVDAEEGVSIQGDNAAADAAEVQRLQAELARERRRAEKAESLHNSYKKRKQNEMKKMIAPEELKRAQDEHERTKNEHEQTKHELSQAKVASMMSETERDAIIKSKKNPRTCYVELLRLVKETYSKLIKGALEPSDDSTQFEFFDNKWIRIVDKTVVSALDKLFASDILTVVSYSYGGHVYNTKLDAVKTTATQTNQSTGQERQIRRVDSASASTATSDSASASTAPSKGYEVLFGADSVVPLEATFVSSMLDELRFDLDTTYEMSRDLAELVEMHSSLAGKYKYCVDAGTAPSNKSAKFFMSHTDGAKDFNSELFVKPMALFNWLSVARARGYKSCRLLLHGCKFKAYEGMRADPLGFDMEFAGKNGQAFGNGVYCGLSDHATVSYNQGSGFAPGSCIVALLLTKESAGWQHHHGGYSRGKEIDKQPVKQYKTIAFGSPETGTDNAIVVHETPLLLQLGHVRAFDANHGWVGQYADGQ